MLLTLHCSGLIPKLPLAETRNSSFVMSCKFPESACLLFLLMFLFSFEIYFKDSRSLLIVFLDKKKRCDLEQHLSTILGRPYSDIAHTPGPASLQRTPIFGEMGSRMLSGFKSDELSTATRRWETREISNVCIVFSIMIACCLISSAVCLLKHFEPNLGADAK